MESKKRGRPKNDSQKILTMRLIAKIDYCQHEQQSKDEKKEKLFLGYEASPPGSYWKRYRLGTRALGYETLEKIYKKAIKLKWLTEPKRSGFVSHELGFLEHGIGVEGMKRLASSYHKRNKDAQKLLGETIAAIEKFEKFLTTSDEHSWSSLDDRYRSEYVDSEGCISHPFDWYEFYNDIENAKKALQSVHFHFGITDLQKLLGQ